MSDIKWDEQELREKLTRFFCEFFGMAEMDADTPMHEVRARAELAGVFLGRTLGAIEHKGEIGADIAMEIRAKEERFKKTLLATAGRLCSPGGELRERWNKRAGRE